MPFLLYFATGKGLSVDFRDVGRIVAGNHSKREEREEKKRGRGRKDMAQKVWGI